MENIVKNQYYFELVGQLNAKNIKVPAERFTPFIERIYNEDVPKLLEYAKDRKSKELKTLQNELAKRIKEFVKSEEGRLQ